MKIIKKMRNIRWSVFIIQTVIPFFIPFIFEIPEEQMAFSIKIIIMCVVGGLDLVIIYAITISEEDDKRAQLRNKAARCAYSNIYQINEFKRDTYIRMISDEHLSYSENIDGAKYCLKEISHSFGNVISEITHIEKEYLEVAFIYNFKDIEQWMWATQKDGTMTIPLDDFVKIPTTVFYQLINPDRDGKLKTVIFYNDKEKMADDGLYYLGTRDNRHNNIGSILGIKTAFSTNEKILIEGILVISTYGKRFVEETDELGVYDFQCLIIEDLFPCYQRMIETELGVLYSERNHL